MSKEIRFTTEKAQRDYEMVCDAMETGNEGAFAFLLQEYRNSVYLMMLKLTNNADDADDLTMESFGKAFTQLHRYTPTHTFSTWLFTIACNTFIDHYRKRRMTTVNLSAMETREEPDVAEYHVPSDDLNPEEKVMKAQRHMMLREKVAGLSPELRVLVELRYFEGLSYEELSKHENIPLGTVKARLFRAHNELYKQISAQREQM